MHKGIYILLIFDKDQFPELFIYIVLKKKTFPIKKIDSFIS